MKKIRDSFAFREMAFEMTKDILSAATDPGMAAQKITEQLRELTGSKVIAIHKCPEGLGGTEHELIAIDPERRREVSKTKSFLALTEKVHASREIVIVDEDQNPDMFQELLDIGLGLSVLVPLRLGEGLVGAIFLLGLPERASLEFVIESMATLCPALALLFRYSLLYNKMEAMVEQKTGALEESLRYWQTTFNSMHNPIFLIDNDGIILRANESTEDFFGKSLEDVLGRHCYEIVHSTEAPPEDYLLFRMKKSLQKESLILPLNDKVVEMEVDPVFAEDGKLAGAVHIIRDVTERRKAEEELAEHRQHLQDMVNEKTKDLVESRQALVSLVEDLNEANDQLTKANTKLQELDRLKSMFIASMSHELRTPLNSIIGFTGIILQGLTGEITEEQRKQLSIVKSSGGHLLALINDVIDVSRIEADKVDLFIEEFDLCAVLQEVKDSFGVTAEQKGLELSLTMPEELIIKSDKRRVKQIITNLVSNAVKFTDKGSVRVSARAIAECGMRNADSKEKEKSEIAVADSGIGIREGDMDNLFKPFSRIITEGALQEGTGLGLYLSQKIANLLGGKIEVESELGKGSVFTLSISDLGMRNSQFLDPKSASRIPKSQSGVI